MSFAIGKGTASAAHSPVEQRGKGLANFDGEPILIEQGKHLAAAFHPELTKEARIHQYFISKCQAESN